jgi:hypothetical protein
LINFTVCVQPNVQVLHGISRKEWIAQEGSMGFWSAFAFGGLALWTAALIGMTWLVKRAPLAKG